MENQNELIPKTKYGWRPISLDRDDLNNYPEHPGSYRCLLSDGSVESVYFASHKNGMHMEPSRYQHIRWESSGGLYVLAWFPNPNVPSDDMVAWLLRHADSPVCSVVDEEGVDFDE